jgi:hypothetical protein
MNQEAQTPRRGYELLKSVLGLRRPAELRAATSLISLSWRVTKNGSLRWVSALAFGSGSGQMGQPG